MLPPEVNSGRIYAGAGSGPMLAAAAAWDGLAADLSSVAFSYESVITGLTGGLWLGGASVSMAMVAASYVAWLYATATQAEQAAVQAAAAAAAYETVFAMTVPPAVIAANRSLLVALNATNFVGQNTPAIAATEADYGEMWAQDAAAMYEYAGASAAASALTPFTSPPPTTNLAAAAGQGAAVAQAAATAAGAGTRTIMSVGSQLLSALPNALQELAQPVQAAVPSLPSFLQLLSLLSPVNLTVASAATAITSTGMAGSYASLGYAVHYDPDGASKMDTILERLGTVLMGSGTGASGRGAAPALSAHLGRASSIGGALSVPPNWVAVAPAIRPVALGWATAAASPISALTLGNPGSLLSEMVLANLVGSGLSSAAPSHVARANSDKTDRSKERLRFAIETGEHTDTKDLTEVSHVEEEDFQLVALTSLEREILAVVRRYTAGN